MNNAEPLIELYGLKKFYHVKNKKNPFIKQRIQAVNDFDLTIFQGETFGLVGESGCGKSTIGHMLAGIIAPSAGELRFLGKDLGVMSNQERKAARQEIQIVMQDPNESLNPKKKIGWIVEEPLLIHTKDSKQTRKRRVAEMLETVGLDGSYLARYPHELSGGQRQRVNIAAALMLGSRLLVADEIVSALDVSIQSQILNLLKNLQKTKGLTYLFISHDLNVVQYMSDRIGVMYLGRLVELGDVDAVYGDARHPYTKALLSTIPSLNGSESKRIILEGEVPSPLTPPAGCPFHTRCYQSQEICAKVPPTLQQVRDKHYASCHFAVESNGSIVL